jgi:hypothetical protein
MRNISLKTWLLIVALLLLPQGVLAEWDFSKNAIPLDEIQSGGPPKDGIPALTNPKYLAASQADFMRDEEQVIGVNLNGVARAYPTRILSWHELVNDRFGDLPVLVSW